METPTIECSRCHHDISIMIIIIIVIIIIIIWLL